MSFSVIIPARYASTRLPGKPLLDIAGKPMIQHVYERAAESNAERIIIATDDQRIADVVDAFGGEICMTSDTHVSGTDRIQEVAQQYQFDDQHIVVNVQGDEPLIPPEVINQVANNLQNTEKASAATLSTLIDDLDELNNPNAVKVITDANQLAIYFSRLPIPFARDVSLKDISLPDILLKNGNIQYQRHLGIYAYRVSLLNRFITWSPAPLEEMESLEQLRIVFNGEKIHVDLACETVPAGIDTIEDLEKVQAIMKAKG